MYTSDNPREKSKYKKPNNQKETISSHLIILKHNKKSYLNRFLEEMSKQNEKNENKKVKTINLKFPNKYNEKRALSRNLKSDSYYKMRAESIEKSRELSCDSKYSRLFRGGNRRVNGKSQRKIT